MRPKFGDLHSDTDSAVPASVIHFTGIEVKATTGVSLTVSRFAFGVTGLSVVAVLLVTLVLTFLSEDQTGGRLSDFRQTFLSSAVAELPTQLHESQDEVVSGHELATVSKLAHIDSVGDSDSVQDSESASDAEDIIGSEQKIDVPRESFLGLVNEIGREGLRQLETSRVIASEYHIPTDASSQNFPVELLASEIVTITNQHFDRNEANRKPVKRILCTVWSPTTATDSMEMSVSRAETLRQKLSNSDFQVVAAVWAKSDIRRPVVTVRIEQ
jgi:hypothetical protein